jgi:hypothetical protein
MWRGKKGMLHCASGSLFFFYSTPNKFTLSFISTEKEKKKKRHMRMPDIRTE